MTDTTTQHTSRSHTIPIGKSASLTITRAGLIIGGLLTALLLTLVLTHTDCFLQTDIAAGGLLYALCILAAVIIGLLAGIQLTLPPRTERIAGITITLLLPIVSLTMIECLGGVFTWDWSPRTLLLNYVLFMLFFGIIYVFSGSFRLPFLIINPLLFLLGLTNHYVLAFRGTPFVPMDFFAAGTAANVMSAYDFSFDYQIIIATVLLAFLTVAACRLRTPPLPFIAKVASRTFFGVLAVCILSIYLFTDLYARAGLAPDFWSQRRGYKNSGTLLNFCINTKYITVDKPAGYNPNNIEHIVLSGADSATQATTTPNILCIMNESLADLSVLGQFETNKPVMPYLDSLRDNTVRGNLYVPTIGAGTSNTEFEFLTGAPVSFFPAGSNAYMLYVKNPLYSLVSTLGAQGYTKQAFHPYYQSGWNRPAVYNHLGFEQFIGIESLIRYDILRDYAQSGYQSAILERLVAQAYPNDNVLLRRYVSDEYNYQKVIEMYEQRDRSQPFFLFNVTMQNHGGYTEQSNNFTEDVYVTAVNGQPTTTVYPKLNQYLSLMHASDRALEDLIDYFSAQSEPTVICLFGDHQPNVETAFVEEMLGSSTLSLTTEQAQKQYVTPFIIWANYDIPEREIERLGANYLSSYLMDVAQVDMPAYNRYLLKLSETLPVINTIGVIDANGTHYAIDEKTPYDDLIADYKQVVYNLIFDDKQRCDSVFTVQ